MALAARKPLSDCEVAYSLLKREKKDSPTWRVNWVACLTLLRAVGHVLDKVDGSKDAHHRDIIARAWETWKTRPKEHVIFWNFIEAERNNLLKQYQFGVAPEPIYVVTQGGDRVVAGGDPVVIEEEFYQLSLKGLEEKDGRDVVGEAIQWWKTELDKIEAQT